MRTWVPLAILVVLLGSSVGRAASDKIDPNLEIALQVSDRSGVVSALVFLWDQVDTQALTARMPRGAATRDLRHEVVVTTLQSTATNTQAGLLAQLDELLAAGEVLDYHAFWVSNTIRVDGTRAALEAISARDDVYYVYLNYPIGLIAPVDEGPSDPGGLRSPEDGVEAVRAPEVWALGFEGDGILVATLDTGVDGNHPALASRWRGVADPRYFGHPGWALFDPVTGWTFPQDSGTHGTHTMGTVCGGSPGDQVGVAPGAQWIHAAVIDRGGISDTVADALLSFEWMLDPDGNPFTSWDVPHVCSNSWGVTTGHGYPECDETFWIALDNCEAADIVMLFSAGNEGTAGLRRPADRATNEYRSAAVGAVDEHTAGWPIADFSSRGPTDCTPFGGTAIKPEIAAPGVSTRSALPGGGYGPKSGTSMASPHVNGVAALVRQACPDLTATEVLQVLYDTAYDLGSPGKDNAYGWGMVDAYEAVQLALDLCISSAGKLKIDRPKYGCADEMALEVADEDLNQNDLMIEQIEITVVSDSEPTGEVVTLTETAADSAKFQGVLELSAAAGDGALLVTDGDEVTATYIDADDGEGHTDVVVTATATIDCVPPVISLVAVAAVGSQTATITFETDEAAVGVVRFGLSCDELTGEAVEAGGGTAHTVVVSGLEFNTHYFFLVEATDYQGNTATDDNGGMCYQFTTPNVVYNFPMDINPGWTTAGSWAFGVPTGGGSYNGDPTSGYTGSKVYGYNLYGDYTNNMPATYLTTPALDCLGLTDVTLSFWRWLGVESNSDFDEATVEVSNNGTTWQVIWRATDTGAAVSDSSWVYQEFNISAIADNQATVYLRWGMGPTDVGVVYPGWNLDDVQIIASGGLLGIGYPEGLPEVVAPGTSTEIAVRIASGEEAYVPDTAMLHYRATSGGSFTAVPLTSTGIDTFVATLPAMGCSATPQYYFSAEGTESGVVYDPPTAPSSYYTAVVGIETLIVQDDFETDEGWTTTSSGATSGYWQRGVPVDDDSWDYDPATDADGSGQCWLTQNQYGNTDVDDGSVTLISPVYDMSSGTVTISYEYFLRLTEVGGGVDRLLVEINSYGGSGAWTEIARHVTDGGLSWRHHEITAEDLDDAGVLLTENMKLRFIANDADPQSINESGLDGLTVVSFGCEGGLTGDMNCDGVVGFGDINPFVLALTSPDGYAQQYPDCPITNGDINGDGLVDLKDINPFVLLLGS